MRPGQAPQKGNATWQGLIRRVVMTRFRIVTDSTCYLDPEWLSGHGVAMVPLLVSMGGKVVKEVVDTDNREFYRYLRQAQQLPTTSQPSAGEFMDVYQRLGQEGLPIISVHISGGISGTVNSASQAREMLPDLDIAVVDSKTTGLGLGHMVMELVEMAEAGKSKEEALLRLRQMVERSMSFFIVADLMYLHKGGRIGGAQALIGSALQIKPILHLKDGKIDVLEKVRTERRAIDRIVDRMLETLAGRQPRRIAAVHADAPEKAQALVRSIEGRLPGETVGVFEIGPVIGTHTGPGLLGLQFHFD
ncbi:MAG TPA: DegV family protein [Firmicutes bacterium]|nr:DegV family protein [Bacillota bacterium]